ncbi:MAG: hypothetical protein ABJ215_07275 [Alphaproteobacteria bacterium]
MNQLTAPNRFTTQLETERREYDDGNPGTILICATPTTPGQDTAQRRAGDWAQRDTATYYDDGEQGTILV